MTGGRDAPGPRVRLIRHAQASWGSADYDCLSPLGQMQARQLGQWLAAEPTTYTRVIRGSMRRHAQTLDAIESAFAAAGRALPATQIDDDWNEFAHEPVLAAYAQAHADDVTLAAAQNGDERAQRAVLAAAVRAWHGGEFDGTVPETWAEFGARIAAARTRLHPAGGDILIITSGGAMWRCVQSALGLDDAGLVKLGLMLRNTGISDFHHGDPCWRMLTWNEVPHLSAAEHLHTHY
jgi:broad specificity phosphatase PhoE